MNVYQKHYCSAPKSFTTKTFNQVAAFDKLSFQEIFSLNVLGMKSNQIQLKAI
jgi:hypothetical protein